MTTGIPFRDPVDRHNGTYRAYKVPLEWAEPHFVPDLVASGAGDPDPVPAGSDLVYTLEVGNGGVEPAIDVEYAIAVPDDTTFQSIVAPEGWVCSTPPVGGVGPVTCSGPSLGAGSSAVVTLDANPADNSIGIDTTSASASALIEDLAAGRINEEQDVRLDWGEIVQGCGYRVLRSTTPDGGFVDISGHTFDTSFVDAGAGSSPESYYYVID